MSQQVIFLHLPVVGQSVHFVLNGQSFCSSPVESVVEDAVRPGWYIVRTTSGSEYHGPVDPNFQLTTAVSQPQTFSNVLQVPLMPVRPVPTEIAYGLNWGAFLLTPFWSFAHRVWMGLLGLLPGAWFVVALILLLKGNEWGWQCRQFHSVEHFRTVQRIWTIWGIVLWSLPIVILAIIVLFSRLLGSAGAL